jgi:hypothetical protein
MSVAWMSSSRESFAEQAARVGWFWRALGWLWQLTW